MRILRLLILGIVLMASNALAADVYVDPDCANTGDGTVGSPCAGSPGGVGPFNTWTGMTWTDGNTYAQKAGTTFTYAAGTQGTITINASGSSDTSRIILTRYGTGDDPKVDGAGSQIGILISGSRSFVTIDHFEVYGVDTSTNDHRYGVKLCSGAGTECTSVNVTNVTIHDIIDPGGIYEADGLWAYCADCLYDTLTVYNIPSDGIWLYNIGATEIKYCNVHDVATSGRATGDGIQLGGTGGGFYIHHNTFDHTSTEVKQAFLDQTAGTSRISRIEYNTMLMSTARDQSSNASKAAVARGANKHVIGNIIGGGWRALDFQEAADDPVVIGNLIYGAYQGQIAFGGTSKTGYFYNNTLDAQGLPASEGFIGTTGTYTVHLYNNIITGTRSVAVEGSGSPTFLHGGNDFYDNTAIGAFSLNGTEITSNPLFVSATDWRTLGNSPVRRAGVTGFPCIDARGRPCYSPPDIGAYQASSDDPATTRSVASTRAAASTRSAASARSAR